MNNNSIVIAGSIVITAIIAAVTFFNVTKSEAKQQAVSACMQAARVESRTANTTGDTVYTTTYTLPIEEWYKRCMKEKGY
jgi:uncharacterized protein (UPF0333 family)